MSPSFNWTKIKKIEFSISLYFLMIFLPFLFAWPHLNCTCLLNIELNPLSCLCAQKSNQNQIEIEWNYTAGGFWGWSKRATTYWLYSKVSCRSIKHERTLNTNFGRGTTNYYSVYTKCSTLYSIYQLHVPYMKLMTSQYVARHVYLMIMWAIFNNARPGCEPFAVAFRTLLAIKD